MSSDTTTSLVTISSLARATQSYRGRLFAFLRSPLFIDVSLAFALTKLIFYGAMLVAFLAIPEYAGGQYQPWHIPGSSIIDASWRWDSGWYGSVIQHGYQVRAGENNIAFFPLYPLLVRLAVGPFSMRWMYLTGVLVTNLALVLALFAVWLYADSFGGRGVARRAMLLLAMFPASFFFSAAYSESVFLMVAAWTLLFLRRDRFALAGATGFFAALARPPGLYVGLPFLIDAWQRGRPGFAGIARRLAWITLIPAGLGVFMLYLWWKFEDPLLFLSAQEAWNHARAFPAFSLADSIQLMIAREGTNVAQFMNVINTAAAIMAIVLGVALLRRNLAGALFVLAGVLAPLTFPIEGSPSISLARYVVVLFPMFVPLARWASRRWVMIPLALVFVPLQLLMAALFIRWYWVI